MFEPKYLKDMSSGSREEVILLKIICNYLFYYYIISVLLTLIKLIE